MPVEARACVYCGESAQTDDHVPPKLLFPRPRPSNLITVPSCRSCNAGFETDDEYFRVAIALRRELSDHPEAKGIFAPVIRGLNRPAQRGFARAIVAAVTSKPILTTSGLVVGHAPAMNVELERLRRTARRIVRALHFSDFRERIAGELRVWSEDDLVGVPEEVRIEVWSTILHPLYASTKRTIGQDVFSYWAVRDPQVPGASAWLLQFFGEVRFLALTLPAGTVAAL